MRCPLKGSGSDAMLRMRGRWVRETPLRVSLSGRLARLSDRLLERRHVACDALLRNGGRSNQVRLFW